MACRWGCSGRLSDRATTRGVQLPSYLAYIVMYAITGKEYTIFGYKGKQVRDQMHCRDVARLFLQFFRNPRAGEIYNLGGGRENSCPYWKRSIYWRSEVTI